jgi:hypothetical protein
MRLALKGSIMRVFKYVGLVLLIAVLVAAIVPASADPGATIDDIVVEGCQLTITFTVADAATYQLEVWDDGSRIWVNTYTPSSGETVTVDLELSGPPVASDVGVYVIDPETSYQYDSRDPVIVPDCAATPLTKASVCSNPQPLDYIVRPVPNGAPAFFAAEADKTTDFSLPAGTWYTSPEPANGFYQVWIACEASPIFIPAEAVG